MFARSPFRFYIFFIKLSCKFVIFEVSFLYSYNERLDLPKGGNMIRGVQDLSLEEKIKSVVDIYDEIAFEYARDYYDDLSDKGYVDKFLDGLTGKNVLDAGCGAGQDCKWVYQRGFKAIGIDFSVKMLDEARKRWPEGTFELMDMRYLEYPENTFDGLMANYSFFHIPTEQIPQVLTEFSRVLKRDGKLLLILQEGNGEMMVEEPFRPGTMEYMNYFTVDDISNLLNKNGFEMDSFERENTPTDLGENKLIVYASNKKIIL